jgi:hypothetical protein
MKKKINWLNSRYSMASQSLKNCPKIDAILSHERAPMIWACDVIW